MWIIGIVLGVVFLLLSVFLVKKQSLRRALRIAGVIVLVLSLLYGALVICLLDGIE